MLNSIARVTDRLFSSISFTLHLSFSTVTLGKENMAVYSRSMCRYDDITAARLAWPLSIMHENFVLTLGIWWFGIKPVFRTFPWVKSQYFLIICNSIFLILLRCCFWKHFHLPTIIGFLFIDFDFLIQNQVSSLSTSFRFSQASISPFYSTVSSFSSVVHLALFAFGPSPARGYFDWSLRLVSYCLNLDVEALLWVNKSHFYSIFLFKAIWKIWDCQIFIK